MSLALVVLGISMLLGCPPSNNSTDDTGGGGPDTTAPTLSSSVPANNAMDFSANADIVLTYSEAVLVGTGNITITPSGGAPITIAVGDAQVTIAGAVVTIKPATDLEMDAAYVLTIPADAFMDAAGNKTAVATVSFRTAAVMAFDTTAPTLVSSSPAEGSTTFSADADITLTYSEPVLVGTGEITLEYSDGTTITIMIDVTGSQVSIAGAVVTINPTNDLDLINTHALVIPAGAFMDAAGNTTAENTVSFTTAAALDTTGPILASSMPADNATGVAVGADIMLTYGEAVQAGTGDITLAASGGDTITIDVTSAQVSIAGIDNTVVTINPTVDLAVGTTYTLTVTAGAIIDASRNPGVVETFSFSTRAAADTTAPTVSSSVPAQDGAAVKSTNIVLTYSESVQRGTGSITITPASGDAISIPVTNTVQVTISGAVVTINPTNDLQTNVRYTVSIPAGAIRDLSGNGAGVFALSFDTTLMTIPSISRTVPIGGATDFENTANIMLTYSEAVQAGSGSITIAPDGSGNTITIAVGGTQVSITGAVVTINPPASLATSTAYTLTVPANAFESSDDQTPVGVFTLPFSTRAALDTTAPFVSSSEPDSGGTIQATEDIVLTYSEAVLKGSGSITLRPSPGTLVTIPISTTQVSVAGNVVTISPMADLLAGNTYALTVPAGSFVDLATPANATADYTLDFSTQAAGDTTAPTVSSAQVSIAGMLMDGSDAEDVDLDTNIVLTYSETVQAGTGNITITPTGGGTALTIAVTDTTQVDIAGAVVTIDPDGDLVGNTVYTVSIPAGVITDNADSPNDAALYNTLSFTTAAPTRRVVLWVARTVVPGWQVNSAISDDCTAGLNSTRPEVATGTVTRRFLATGSGNNQNPANFTLNVNGTGGLLSAYAGATPVFAAHSATTVFTDNDKVANSYADLISPTIDLLRTFSQAGLNGEERGIVGIVDILNPPPTRLFWTGITNSQSMGRYVPGPACQQAGVTDGPYWNLFSRQPDGDGSLPVGGVGISSSVIKQSHAGGNIAKGDVLAGENVCTNSYNVVCMTY